MDNYKVIEQKIRNLEPFRGNTLTGVYVGEVYKIFSYETLIAEVGNMGNKLINDTKYSVTTSKQQNIIRRAWGIK